MEASHQQRGIQLFELGRYEEAIKYFGEDLESWNNRYYLSLCYYNLNNFTKAQQLADGLLSEKPDSELIFFLKAQIARALDKEKEALSFINQAIQLHPFDADFFGLKAAILLQLKRYEEGLQMANEGLHLNATNALSLNMRAQLLTKLDRVNEAQYTVEDILLNDPENAYSHTNVGWIALENNQTQKALTHFKEALQKDPNYEYAREGMSTALKSKNIVYKWYLKYNFWIAKKSSGSQWVFIIGIYLVYRFSSRFLIENDLTFLAIPLMVAYLLFALGSWLMEPMSNMILGFDSYGKYLLSHNEKLSGYTFGVLLCIGLICISIFYSVHIDYFLPVAVAAIAAMIPLPRAFLQTSKKGRLAGFITGGIILFIGLFGLLFTPNAQTVALAAFFGMIIFTWVGNAFND